MFKTFRLAAPLACAAVLLTSLTACSQSGKDAFYGHMFAQEYAEAAHMLSAPSDIELNSDGSLLITDRTGNATIVPAVQLPFMAAGSPANPKFPGSTLMATGPDTDGTLDYPAVTLYVTFSNGEAHIEGVDV